MCDEGTSFTPDMTLNYAIPFGIDFLEPNWEGPKTNKLGKKFKNLGDRYTIDF